MDKKRLGVYIHIPFCAKKCNYCDFLSFPCGEETKAKYCRALMREIDARSNGNIIDTVFFGGGTPSVIDASFIADIMERLKAGFEFTKDAEISIECNPGTINLEKFLIYKSAGINRISVGLQSADDNELKMLGRIHTFDEFKKSYELARDAGFDNINIDIMSALPGQTRESYARTLERAIEINPEHISAYSLIVEENTPLYDMVNSGKMTLPDEDTEREMYYDTARILAAAGYERYEISNYARSGYECRHNVGYWTGKNYIGLGIGAASFIDGVRYNNCRDIGYYIENSRCTDKISENKETLTERDMMEEFMFLGLRMIRGVSKTKFAEKFGVCYDDIYGSVSEELESKGLIETDGDTVRLTGKGIDVSNYALSYFLFDK